MQNRAAMMPYQKVNANANANKSISRIRNIVQSRASLNSFVERNRNEKRVSATTNLIAEQPVIRICSSVSVDNRSSSVYDDG